MLPYISLSLVTKIDLFLEGIFFYNLFFDKQKHHLDQPIKTTTYGSGN